VFVLVLTAMPCNNDVPAANTNSVSIELTKQNPNQANDVDLCSPFCFCHCCQTLFLPSFFCIANIDLVEITLDIQLKELSFSSPFPFIWQPPKI